jgi:hypothetical protein
LGVMDAIWSIGTPAAGLAQPIRGPRTSEATRIARAVRALT